VNGPELIFYTVYQNPDFPGQVVVRRARLGPGGALLHERAPWFVGTDLEEARASIPQHLHQQPRLPGDDPVILEVWF
jgi:hypothetical protein